MRTNVAVVVDRSSSISQYGLTHHVRKMVNDIIGTFAKVERDTGQEYVIDLWTFADVPQLVYSGFSAGSFPEFTGYAPYGNTALFDAVCKAACQLPWFNIDHANLVIVITDGEENRSKMPLSVFQQKLKSAQDGGRFTFVFHVPPGKKSAFVLLSGVPADNVQEWEQTEAGTRQVYDSHVEALQRYSAVRSKGLTATDKYFATTDASNITDRDLAACRCNKSRFKLYTVQKETAAKEFAEEKSKSRYVIGQLFYQLMKPETVQELKEIVLRDKSTGHYYAGANVRNLIGIPREKRVKVDPGNHANYDVFVQSTSVNRKLPRGTKVLIDTSRVSDLPPTWDHTSVKKPVILTEHQKKLIGVK